MRAFAAAVLITAAPALPPTAASSHAGRPARGGVCDLYLADKTPCVAAHSMTRALYGGYDGPLYTLQKKQGRGFATKDIGVVSPGGIADTASHDAWCGSSVCVVQRIWDQSPKGNHLGIERGAANLAPPRNVQDIGVNFTDNRSRTTLGGKPVYSAFFAGTPKGYGYHPFLGQGYSNRTAVGTAVGDEPQTLYAVFGGRYFNDMCCFDYGNGENVRGGKEGVLKQGTMEAIYFGEGYGRSVDGGPGVGVDMEVGVYGNTSAAQHSVDQDFVAAMVKGASGNHYAIKIGDPQKGPRSLQTAYDGPRPTYGPNHTHAYDVMQKQGGIILGIGGDNSPWGGGIFYEGVMTQGISSDATDATVMANIASAGYGK